MNPEQYTEQSQFFDACRRGDIETVKSLFNANPDLIHIEDVKGFSPLIIAAYNNQADVADFLLQNGADVNVQDAAITAAAANRLIFFIWED